MWITGKTSILALIAAVVLVAGIGLISEPAVGGRAPISGGDVDTERPMTTLDGGQVRLADYAGKVVLIDFWASWCEPCRRSLPTVRDLHQDLGEGPFAVIGISTDTERERLETTLAEHGLPWPQVWDEDRSLQGAFAVRVIPTYVVVDHRGQISEKVEGWSFGKRRRLIKAVKKAVRRAAEAT